MSAYDNPRIINDQSAMAWANAAAKLSETMVQSIQNMVKFRQQQKAVANEKQDRFNLAWNKVALAQNKNLRETIKASKEQGVDTSLVKQFQNIQRTIMQGGEGS
jgi:predicted mannosyl-3-phosphoglycerate phosphatase (HAD superfamily)